jgi:hypothetical protein
MFIDLKERDELQKTLFQQARRLPSAPPELEDGTDYSTDELAEFVLSEMREFLRNTIDPISLAVFAVDLLEYCNGPRPEIELRPTDKADDWPKFRVLLEP